MVSRIEIRCGFIMKIVKREVAAGSVSEVRTFF